MMIMMGGWWVITGLVGLFNSEFYIVTLRRIFQLDISTWAWIHLIIGIIVLVAGFFLFQGAIWACVVGVIVAIVAGLVAFAWLPYYPVWAILFIVISIGVICALTAHGRDITMA